MIGVLRLVFFVVVFFKNLSSLIQFQFIFVRQ